MKKIARFRNFAKGGINTDMPAHDLPNSFITNGNNFRCENNSLLNFGGQLDYGATGDADTQYIAHVRNAGRNYYVGAGKKLTAFDGSYRGVIGDFDIIDPSLWSSCIMGGILVFNHPEIGPHYWVPSSVTTEVIPLPWDVGTDETWQDKDEGCKVIRAHKSFLIALDLYTPTADEMPHGVRWSDPADNNDIPYTWDHTDPANLAGLNNLHDFGGAIRDGLSLRDNFIIYREGAIWRMDYTGGPWVWNFRKQSFSIGALARDCVTEVQGAHLVFGDGDIVLYDGNSVKSLVNDRIRRRINSSISTENFLNSFVVQHKDKKEVWCCFPENGNTWANKAYIWNWENNTWALRDLDDIAHAAFGAVSGLENNDDGSWNDGDEVNWGDNDVPWNSQPYIPFSNTLIGAKLTGELKQLDPIVDESSNVVDTLIERTDIAIDTQENVTSVDRIYPNISGQGVVDIRLGSQQFAGGPVSWKPARQFNVGVDRKLDIRSTGELHAIQIKANTSEKFRLSGFDFEYTPAGKR